MTKQEILELTRRWQADAAPRTDLPQSDLERALIEHFPPEKIVECLSSLPEALRDKFIQENIAKQAVSKTTRTVRPQ